MQTRIILIRHGQTRANVERRYIGVTESSLTPLGKHQ
ncbi:MAG: histidine phosphatase family protein, partial [Candidatus Omnitrophica bacterium]|nr:histidine phosphatase family protein [Candidatus Omnitrophota bacterium]